MFDPPSFRHGNNFSPNSSVITMRMLHGLVNRRTNMMKERGYKRHNRGGRTDQSNERSAQENGKEEDRM